MCARERREETRPVVLAISARWGKRARPRRVLSAVSEVVIDSVFILALVLNFFIGFYKEGSLVMTNTCAARCARTPHPERSTCAPIAHADVTQR